MLQICGMRFTWKSESQAKLIGHFSPYFRPSLTEVSHVAWHGVPLKMTDGTKWRCTKGPSLTAKVLSGGSPETATAIYHLSGTTAGQNDNINRLEQELDRSLIMSQRTINKLKFPRTQAHGVMDWSEQYWKPTWRHTAHTIFALSRLTDKAEEFVSPATGDYCDMVKIYWRQ
jgi:hypothetical protein